MKTINGLAARIAVTVFLSVVSNGSVSVAAADHLTVVELFQSQGCSDCPPANSNLIALSNRPDLLTLSFSVTYWDQLGWKDTFASTQYTDRQWDYAHALHHREVFTPQVVVNGRADVVGANRSELEALIRREASSGGPDIRIDKDVATVGPGTESHAQVWLVRYDPNIVQVSIARGENGGRTLPHKDIVKQLVKLGDWSGQPQAFQIPPPVQEGLREAILVQDGPGGSILAAARN